MDGHDDEGNEDAFGEDNVPPLPPVPEIALVSGFNTARPRFEPVKVHFAINSGDLVAVQKYVENAYDLNYIIYGHTPLTLAILKDQFEIAHLLVDSGCNVNLPEKTKWKRLPIHLAACAGDAELTSKIIEKGCPVDARDMTDLTALHWASLHGHEEVVKVLITSGANIHLKDDAGRTSLHRAAENGHESIVCILHSEGACVNAQDKRGWSALFQAVACNDLQLVKTLIELNINVNLEDFNQETALHIIANRLRGKNILVLCRTDVNIYTRHLAVFNKAVQRAQQTLGNELPITEVLINNGANVNNKNIWGETAAYVAAEEGYGAILKVLYDAGADLTNEPWILQANIPANLATNIEICEWLNDVVRGKLRSLQQSCKYVIRSQISRSINDRINSLPLPPKLLEFLKVNP